MPHGTLIRLHALIGRPFPPLMTTPSILMTPLFTSTRPSHSWNQHAWPSFCHGLTILTIPHFNCHVTTHRSLPVGNIAQWTYHNPLAPLEPKFDLPCNPTALVGIAQSFPLLMSLRPGTTLIMQRFTIAQIDLSMMYPLILHTSVLQTPTTTST